MCSCLKYGITFQFELTLSEIPGLKPNLLCSRSRTWCAKRHKLKTPFHLKKFQVLFPGFVTSVYRSASRFFLSQHSGLHDGKQDLAH